MTRDPLAEMGLGAAAVDQEAWGRLLRQHEERLRRLVAFRLDARLRGRIDAADVVQDVFVAACEHRNDFVARSDVSLFLWLRGIAANKMLELHRRHLGVRMRDAKRDVSLNQGALTDDTSAALADRLVGKGTRASEAAARDEVKAHLQLALDQMNPLDREILALKHYEQLTSREAAQVLGIEERAASKRYLRALARLKTILAAMPGGIAGMAP